MQVESVRRRAGIVAAAGGLMLVMAGRASAHPGAATLGGFGAGFAHPLAGLDHVLAMVAIGLWAAQLGGRALWMVPASFVVMMTAGGMLGVHGVPLPLGEQGVALSVLLAGVLVAAFVRPPLVLATVIAALFALAHGHVHGSEMPVLGSVSAWVAGFVAATALLHGAGVALAVALRERAPVAFAPALGALGAVIAAVGTLLLVRPGLFA